MQADNLTSVFEPAFININMLRDTLDDMSSTNFLNTTVDVQLNTIKHKLEEIIDNIISWKLTPNDASYRLFNEVNKKQFISSIYLTRIVAITNKIYKVIDEIKVDEFNVDELDNIDKKKIQSDLSILQRIFKRRPSEAIGIHFDIITDMLSSNDYNYKIIDAFDKMCDELNNNITRDILNEGKRVKNQICNKQYSLFYNKIQSDLNNDFKMAKKSLATLVNALKSNNETIEVDVFQLFDVK